MKQPSCLPIIVVLLALYSAPSYEAGITTIEDIKCENVSSIEFTLDIADHDNWSDADVATWELQHGGASNPNCQPSFTSPSGKVKYGAFSADECKTSLTENANGLTLDYEFKIQVSAPGNLTFQYDHDYTITCTYNREKQGLQASFLPQHSITGTGTGSGQLDFTFELFNGNTKIESGSTTKIELETALTGKLKVSESGFPTGNFTVFFVSVTVDKESLNNSSPITMITNGCADDAQQAANFVENPSSCDGDNTDEFSFKAFRLSGQTENDKVEFTVTAKVCYNNVGGCSCNCNDRKRRSTLEETSRTLYYIRAGPFTFVDADGEEKQADTVVDEDKDSSVPVHVVTIGVVGGVVAVAIICVAVIIVLRKRRYNVTLTESRGTHEFATPGV